MTHPPSPADAAAPPGVDALLDDARSPVAGAMITCLCALVLTLGGWIAWAEVEEVVAGQGRVEPAGRVKIINHPHGGRVAEIHVRDGQRVEAGAPLVTFDPAVGESQRAELLGRWQARAADSARLEAEAAGLPTVGLPTVGLPAELAASRPDLAAAQARLMAARAAALASQRDVLARAVEARRGELRTVAAEGARIRSGLGLLREQLGAVQELADRGLYPRLKLVAVRREVGDAEGELAKARAQAAAAEAALAEATTRLEGLDFAWRSEVLGELAASTTERDRLREELTGLETRLADMVVRAPVDGIVAALALTGPGQAVGPTDPLMKLVPADAGLVVEARIANEDIGRIRVGMPATVKVRAFDYLRYGALRGTVRQVAADASPEPRSGALGYAVTVETERLHLGSAPGAQDLAPGMVVDVEVGVGSRTVLSYLTDRILVTRDRAFTDG